MNIHHKNKRLFFFLIWGITAFVVFKVLQGYLSLIFISIMYSIIVYPLYFWLTKKLHRMHRLATIITIVVSFFIIIVPLIIAGNLFINEALRFKETIAIDTETSLTSIDRYISLANDLTSKIPGLRGAIEPEQVEHVVRQAAQNLSKFLLSKAIQIGSSSVNIITNFFLFLITIYFTIPQIPHIKDKLKNLSPLDDKIDQMYIDRATAMMMSLLKGTFLIAIVQGIIGGLLLWIAGVDYILTLTIAMVILAVLPVIGTAFVTIPIGLFFLASGNIFGGAVILLGQIIIMSNIDNILRAELAARDTPLHPVLLLLSIIGGIQLFGPLGFIYGPIIMILFMTSLEIYTKHYKY